MSKIEKLREESKNKQNEALACFAKVQFATMNADNSRWDSVSTKALEEAINNFSLSVHWIGHAEAAIVVAMASVDMPPPGPSPAELTSQME
jgi:hypothetical protein